MSCNPIFISCHLQEARKAQLENHEPEEEEEEEMDLGKEAQGSGSFCGWGGGVLCLSLARPSFLKGGF